MEASSYNIFHPTKQIKLEIHWRLNPGPGKEPGFEELWKRKRKSTLTSNSVYMLGRKIYFCFLYLMVLDMVGPDYAG